MTHLDAANPLNWPAGVLTTGSKNLNLVRMVVVMRQKFFIFFFSNFKNSRKASQWHYLCSELMN
jgi:hypothetical protein